MVPRRASPESYRPLHDRRVPTIEYRGQAVNEKSTRQSFLGPDSDKVLGDLTVAIVGLGGGGSHIAQQLVHLGVRRFVLFDPDHIEESNLNRLVGGTREDVSRSEWKVRISTRIIRSVTPAADVIVVEKPWQERAEHLRDCDIIFGCIDTFAGRDELERVARRYFVPYIDVGLDVHRTGQQYVIAGQVALSMPGEACMHCMNVLRADLLAEEAAQYGDAGGRPQVVWANGVLASMAIGIMVQLVAPWHEKHQPPCLLEYDGNRHEVRASSSVSFLLQKRCPHYVAIADVGDPWYGRKPSA